VLVTNERTAASSSTTSEINCSPMNTGPLNTGPFKFSSQNCNGGKYVAAIGQKERSGGPLGLAITQTLSLLGEPPANVLGHERHGAGAVYGVGGGPIWMANPAFHVRIPLVPSFRDGADMGNAQRAVQRTTATEKLGVRG
jgi:hypothetical protein